MEGNESYLTQDELNRVNPLVVAIVGPTNEGKTSILRTLTNDPEFGCVNAYTGTTIRAEMQRVFCRGAAEILQLIDTPGFQTSSEILENVTENSLAQDQDGEYTLADILAAIPTEDEDFRHDLRAWREIEKCDVVLFVANVAEDPRRSLLKSTITLLQHIGKPTLVAYNNLGVQGDEGGRSADFRKEWDATLFQKRFFLVQCYDAHRRVFSDEVALFEKLVALSRDPLTRRVLRMELEDRKARERRRLEESRRIIAELLLDVATCRYEASNVDSSQLQGLLKQLQGRLTESVMRRELKAQSELLKTWGFRPSVLNRELLQVEEETKEEEDRSERLKRGASLGATIGATVGLAADIALAGLSLGVGTAVGAALGGALGGGASIYGARYDKSRKRLSLRVSEGVLKATLAREVALVHHLQTRGKAMEDSVAIRIPAHPSNKIELPIFWNELHDAAERRDFSSMSERKGATEDLGAKLKGLADLKRATSLLTGTPLKTRDDVLQTLSEELRKALPDFVS